MTVPRTADALSAEEGLGRGAEVKSDGGAAAAAGNLVYHVKCFQCCKCDRALQTGPSKGPTADLCKCVIVIPRVRTDDRSCAHVFS